eukprot:scaffold2103_cov185-Amphora_coffeaeformis.AAC.4
MQLLRDLASQVGAQGKTSWKGENQRLGGAPFQDKAAGWVNETIAYSTTILPTILWQAVLRSILFIDSFSFGSAKNAWSVNKPLPNFA